jgi:APA family basic amino acid/polyamine antiporter
MAKDGLFFKQATILNKNQVPAKALWVRATVLVFLVSLRLVNNATFASLLYILTIFGYLY